MVGSVPVGATTLARRAMTSQKENHVELGVAIIGLGIMGTRMMSSLTFSNKFRLVAAWDPNDHACGVAAVDYPGLLITKDAATAIGADGVDIVYIACPPGAHVEYAVMAADAGKAVYCEKPLGVDIAESEQLVHMIAERQIINAVNFPFAASSSVDVIESELASGALGEIVGVDLRLHFVPWPRGWQQEATWLSQRAEGGYVREVGSHFVFLIEKLFGPAELTDSSVAYPEDDAACETLFSANLDCAGVPISMSGTSLGVGPDTVELIIWGSERSIKLDNWVEVSVTSGGGWELQEIYGADARQENNTRFFGDLENLLHGRPNTIATFADALSVQRIVESILSTDPQHRHDTND